MTPADLLAIAERPAPPVLPGQLAVPDGPAIGSVCTGYGGLDAAVQQVIGGHLAWVADPDPGATAILTHHHPDVPNLGDITALDWATVPPVDVLCGGYPCQPFSVAGLRKGTADERHIWPHIARALGVLRPRVAIFENVSGHLRLGFDTVLADLAALGFDAEWCLVRASEVGAPHQRNRLIVLAVAADAADLGHQWGGEARGRGNGPAHDRDPAADASRAGLEVRGIEPDGPERQAAERGRRQPAPDAEGERLQGHSDVAAGEGSVQRGPDAHGRGEAPADSDGGGRRPLLDELRPGQPDADWGSFLPAVRRWERAIGRPAPRATDDRNRLSPLFVEWLMGLPAGHVTAVPELTRTQQLHALGNGVVPPQAAAALRLLLDRAPITT